MTPLIYLRVHNPSYTKLLLLAVHQEDENPSKIFCCGLQLRGPGGSGSNLGVKCQAVQKLQSTFIFLFTQKYCFQCRTCYNHAGGWPFRDEIQELKVSTCESPASMKRSGLLTTEPPSEISPSAAESDLAPIDGQCRIPARREGDGGSHWAS